MRIGQIYRHAAFYLDRETGQLQPKYLVALARTPGGDIVARLLTSRAHGRPERPPCYHGDPYPGFYLGVLGGPLAKKTWVDLRAFPELDDPDATALITKGTLTMMIALSADVLVPLLECVAGAVDTTRLQEQALRNELARLR